MQVSSTRRQIGHDRCNWQWSAYRQLHTPALAVACVAQLGHTRRVQTGASPSEIDRQPGLGVHLQQHLDELQ